MTTTEGGLPARPFFSCTPEGLTIVDARQARSTLASGDMKPWMVFQHGPGNILDTTPKKVAGRQGSVLDVECAGGTVHIDFADGRAWKTTTQGEFVYMGTLEERNDGRGYIPLS